MNTICCWTYLELRESSQVIEIAEEWESESQTSLWSRNCLFRNFDGTVVRFRTRYMSILIEYWIKIWSKTLNMPVCYIYKQIHHLQNFVGAQWSHHTSWIMTWFKCYLDPSLSLSWLICLVDYYHWPEKWEYILMT